MRSCPAAVAGQTEILEDYHLDTLGSVRVVTDQSGQIVKDSQGQEVRRHDFLPFGEEWPAATTREKKLFTGQEHDPETGLDYFGARYYHAQLGRFTDSRPGPNDQREPGRPAAVEPIRVCAEQPPK